MNSVEKEEQVVMTPERRTEKLLIRWRDRARYLRRYLAAQGLTPEQIQAIEEGDGRAA